MTFRFKRGKTTAAPAANEPPPAPPPPVEQEEPEDTPDAASASADNSVQPTPRKWWCLFPPPPNNPDPIWFAAYRTRRYLTSWGVVFISFGVLFTLLWFGEYSDMRLLCGSFRSLAVVSWGSMAAAAFACYGTAVVLFGMSRAIDLRQAQHDALMESSSQSKGSA